MEQPHHHQQHQDRLEEHGDHGHHPRDCRSSSRQCRERQHSLNLIKTKISRAQQNGTVWRSPTNRSNSYLAQGLKLLLQLLPGKSACLQKIESGAQHPHPRARQPGSLELLRFHLLLKLKQRRHAEISATKA